MKRVFAIVLCLCLITGMALAENLDPSIAEGLKTFSDDELEYLYGLFSNELHRRNNIGEEPETTPDPTVEYYGLSDYELNSMAQAIYDELARRAIDTEQPRPTVKQRYKQSFNGCTVEYLDWNIVHEGKEDKIIIKCKLTNTGYKKTSFGMNAEHEAYQNGNKLSSKSTAEGDTNYSTDVMPGESLDVLLVYTLEDLEHPVTFIADDLWDGRSPDGKYDEVYVDIDIK